jgi:hypothetical protein
MLKKLLSYEVAAKFSWAGQKGKGKFCQFDFHTLILSKNYLDTICLRRLGFDSLLSIFDTSFCYKQELSNGMGILEFMLMRRK